MMTKQEVLDTVYHHLLVQGAKSINESGLCLYRGPNGLMCAAGVLIKDEFYDRSIESSGVTSSPVKRALLNSGVSREALELIQDLQSTHDELHPDDWDWRLKEVAATHGLQVPA